MRICVLCAYIIVYVNTFCSSNGGSFFFRAIYVQVSAGKKTKSVQTLSLEVQKEQHCF